MPPWRGEGMTDTPTGLSRYPDTGHGARTQPHPPKPSEPADFPSAFSSMRPAASTSRTCGRYAVGPRPIPDTDAYPGAPTDRRRRSKTPRTRLTDPAPFRDDQHEGCSARRGRVRLFRTGPRQSGADGFTDHWHVWSPICDAISPVWLGVGALPLCPGRSAGPGIGGEGRAAPAGSAAEGALWPTPGRGRSAGRGDDRSRAVALRSGPERSVPTPA